jgi:cytochrome c6
LKKLISLFTVAFAVVFMAFSSPAFAGDAASGGKIFSANCAACHAGGNNVIMANKTLKKEALAQYGMNSIEAITTQVTKGKNAMPAFGGRLSAAQIEDVATYVLSQSEKGW